MFLRGVTRLEESRSPEAPAAPDLVGVALIAAGIGLTVLGLVEADRWRAISLALVETGGVALLAAFVAWARGRDNSALDLSLFREPSYAWTNTATLVFGAAFSMMSLSVFLFLTGPWRLGLGEAGLLVTPGPLAVAPVAVVVGRLAGRIGHGPLLVVGGLVYAASNLWFWLRFGPTPSLPA